MLGQPRSNWPEMVDRHGMIPDDSGWCAPPPDGWPRELTPSEIAAAMPSAALYPAQTPALVEPSMEAGQSPSMPQRQTQLEYADRTPDQLGPDIAAALTAMAGDGWHLVTFDGQRYIFDRPRQDSPELHER
jgi:hypothetical protein